MSLTRILLVVAVGSACGPKPAPIRPTQIELAALAAELNTEMAEVAHAIHVRRDDCPGMTRELRAVFQRMATSIAKAHRAQLDDAVAKRLVIELRAYDQDSARHRDAIDADFTVDSPCARDHEVREVLMSMPTL